LLFLPAYPIDIPLHAEYPLLKKNNKKTTPHLTKQQQITSNPHHQKRNLISALVLILRLIKTY